MEQIVRNITCEIRHFLRMGELIMPAQQNKPWTEEDDRRLIKMRAAGRSMASISAALKRSAGAVAGRIGALRSRARAKANAGPAVSEDDAR